ncbi:MAG: tRNA (guanosine(46)-N7)-methyltransferase TrmB [Candidatus Borkfalkiaceae bacterium]|nr:tRNA (guanosine(46)-N7)-methyltransferase TrmB [Christensenellaceae bacterium]
MRMRRKKHLEERLSEAGQYLVFTESDEVYSLPEKERFRYIDRKEIFGKEEPLLLEIGCGKGKFSCEMARRNPDKQVIGVEKLSNVIVEALEQAKKEDLKNCAFLNCDAQNLGYYLKENSVESIFLNFSSPYPKNTYKNRRLTNPSFLRLFRKLLVSGGRIFFKTDNRKFFEYSLLSFNECGFRLKDLSLDLHADDYPDNIVTEYEKNYVDRGYTIYYAEVEVV